VIIRRQAVAAPQVQRGVPGILPPRHELSAYVDGPRFVLVVTGPAGERYALGVCHGPPSNRDLSGTYYTLALQAWSAVRERAREHVAVEGGR
jgi:hypothetical protein